jgi:hypothetical protein
MQLSAFPLSFEEEVHHHGAILIDMKDRRSTEMVEDILDGFYKKITFLRIENRS